jgi:hypothetical protein
VGAVEEVLKSGVNDSMDKIDSVGKFDPSILERMATAAKELSKSGARFAGVVAQFCSPLLPL